MFTFVHVVVFPLPCKPTNITILGLFFTGCHALTSGSMSYFKLILFSFNSNSLVLHTRTSSFTTADWINRRLFKPTAVSSRFIACLIK